MSYQFTRTHFDACVAKAVRHLDKHQADWQKGIDLTSLDQENGRVCAVAQLTKKSWKLVAPHLGLYEREQHVSLGFFHALPDDAGDVEQAEYYKEMTSAFKRAIIRLRSKSWSEAKTLKTAA